MSATPRPPAVTMACVFVGFSSFLILMELIGALTSWGTIEMQEALQPTLTRLHEQGVDVPMGELLAVLRWVALGSVVVLVAGIVFAVYAVRGDRVSRVGLTVTAVLLGLLVVWLGLLGVLLATFLLVAAASLWSADARRWYATHSEPVSDPMNERVAPPADTWAPPTYASPSTVEAPAPPRPATQRPRAVLAAGLVTVLGSTMVGGLSALYLIVYGFAREEYIKVVREGPFADWYSAAEVSDAMRLMFWACLVMLPLAAAGLAAGLSLLARLPVGRAATLALSWITAAVGVVLIPVGLLGTGAAIAVIVLLNRDESRAWTAGAR